MSNTTPTPITDKNGKQTTVHKKTDTASKSAARVAGIKPKKRTKLPEPLVPAPHGALGFEKHAIGHTFYFTENPTLGLYGGATSSSLDFSARTANGVVTEIDSKIDEIDKELSGSNKHTAGEKNYMTNTRNHLSALKEQLQNPTGLANIKKSHKADSKVWDSVGNMENMRYDWDLDGSNINAISRYGDYVVQENPGISG